MKLNFNTTHMEFLDLELKDVLLMMVIKLNEFPRINTISQEAIEKLIKKQYIQYSMRACGYILTELGETRLHEIQTEPEEQEDVGKKDKEITDLVEKMRELFPAGTKTGTTAWRGNRREVASRLKKFFKLYGAKYSSEEIIDATRRYVDSFNGDYKFMRVLPYFIMKSPRVTDAEGIVHIEDKSDLATFLENPTAGKGNSFQNDDDWADNMR